MTDVLDIIRRYQTQITAPDTLPPPLHDPQMLLIGCVDARLNIKSEIGIPDGAALIHRNVAALVRSKPAPSDHEGSSVAASLEFAINVMHVKHIVVMGHTDCGGIRACLQDSHDHDTQGIRDYLKPLASARAEVVARGGDIAAQARVMEEAAVRQSLLNLKGYEVVEKALRDGTVGIHGWVINTASKRILEMDPVTGKFSPMSHA